LPSPLKREFFPLLYANQQMLLLSFAYYYPRKDIFVFSKLGENKKKGNMEVK
jgi:hypothetical protein